MTRELLYAPTDDGWQLAVQHWPVADATRRHAIIMLHGLGANRLHFDLDARYSLAREARRRGFEVFVIELRGAGMSRAPFGRDRALYQWGFGDYVDHDLPALLQFVADRCDGATMHLVAHSMGGMLAYAAAVRWPKCIHSIAAIGAPLAAQLELGLREKRLLQLAASLSVTQALRRVPLKRLLGTAGRFVPLSHRLADGVLFNRNNLEPEVMSRMAREAIDDIPLRLVSELVAEMARARRGQAQDSTSPYAHEAQLGEITAPVLAIAGAADRVARLPSVRAVVERLRGPDVRFRAMGRSFGDRADYGHVDLLVGRHAPEEIYPQVLDFVEELD